MDSIKEAPRRKDPPNLNTGDPLSTVTRSTGLLQQSSSADRISTRRSSSSVGKRYSGGKSIGDAFCEDLDDSLDSSFPSRRRSSLPMNPSRPSRKAEKDHPKQLERKDSSTRPVYRRHGPSGAATRGRINGTDTQQPVAGRPPKKQARGNSRSNQTDVAKDMEMDRFVDPLVTDHNCNSLQELLHITHNLSFYKPDTYPIYYAAQLLGLTHVLCPSDNEKGDRLNTATNDGVMSVPELLSRLKQLPPPHPQGNKSRTHDGVFVVPSRGVVADHVKFWGGSCYQNNDAIWLRQQLKDPSRSSATPDVSQSPMLDPLYVQLWSTPEVESVRVPVTPAQYTRLFHSVSGLSKKPAVTADYAPLEDADVAPVVGAEVAMGELVAPSSTTSPPAWKTVILDMVWRAHNEVMEVLATVQKGFEPPEQTKLFTFLSLEEARDKYPLDVEEFLTTHQQPPNQKTTSTGISAGFVAVVRRDLSSPTLVLGTKQTDTLTANTTVPRCRIVGAIVYQFEWYRGARQPTEASELIMHIQQIAVTTNQQPATSERIPGDSPGVGNDTAGATETPELDQTAAAWIRVMLTALVLEQARFYNVWYAVVPSFATTERGLLLTFFGMIETVSDPSTLICDLHQGSSRFSFLLFHERLSKPATLLHSETGTSEAGISPIDKEFISPKRRWLVRLPTVDEAKSAISAPTVMDHSNVASVPSILPDRSPPSQVVAPAQYFSSADKLSRDSVVAIRAVVSNDNSSPITLHKLNIADGSVGALETLPSFYREPPSLDILRGFLLECHQCGEADQGDTEDALVLGLMSKQNELADLENQLAPRIQSLFASVVTERVEYESAAASAKREDEIRILADSQDMTNRRKELDVAWQQQLELDMDAVCEICADGDVTPDNQILFCESCNVAVHQMCYGIDQVPEGDYYCLPCRRLGRETAPPQVAPQTLPICCELCPLRQGAFIRTDVKQRTAETDIVDKWVHVVCAKWLGLNYVNDGLQETIEDVTDLTTDFRRHRIKCDLCLGERGGMNQCAHPSCKKYFHVTCARAVGTMKVTHGENCKGPVVESAWKLFCAHHSDAAKIFVPKNVMSTECLILTARGFPPEPKPPPIPRPFNTLTGWERKELLADSNYESALIDELLTKRYVGVRCDVCDVVEDESKSLLRCVTCNTTFCVFCKVDCDENKGAYKCKSCIFVERNQKEEQEFEPPQCSCCYQRGGLLREASASPINMKTWRKRQEQLKASVFGKPIWTHSVCACWLPELDLPKDTGIVDLSNVFLADGKGQMVNWKQPCFLCGQKGGMKMDCDHSGCSYSTAGGRAQKMIMHVTCARQAGFEVVVDQKRVNKSGGPYCYVRCYRHCGNEFNLRAKLEDLLEIEKRRAGKDLAKANAPMTFPDAARLLNSSISVLRVLGWAWRWAYLWVDYNSSWEPLLEKGQDESTMTDDELKIVYSTRESRGDDARKCRLAAFGAALRNRSYDTIDGCNNVALERALRAILQTKSLVGPLDQQEIDFFVEWLSRAYRSKSSLLCFGENKNEIASEPELCLFKDSSPKYELGERPIPGTQELATGQDFEAVTEVDDFFESEMLSPRRKTRTRKRSSGSSEKSGSACADRTRTASVGVALAMPRRKRAASSSSLAGDTTGTHTPSPSPKQRCRPPRDRRARKRSVAEDTKIDMIDDAESPYRPSARRRSRASFSAEARPTDGDAIQTRSSIGTVHEETSSVTGPSTVDMDWSSTTQQVSVKEQSPQHDSVKEQHPQHVSVKEQSPDNNVTEALVQDASIECEAADIKVEIDDPPDNAISSLVAHLDNATSTSLFATLSEGDQEPSQLLSAAVPKTDATVSEPMDGDTVEAATMPTSATDTPQDVTGLSPDLIAQEVSAEAATTTTFAETSGHANAALTLFEMATTTGAAPAVSDQLQPEQSDAVHTESETQRVDTFTATDMADDVASSAVIPTAAASSAVRGRRRGKRIARPSFLP